MSNQIFEEQPTDSCIRLWIFCSWPSIHGRYKFLSITSQQRKYVFLEKTAPSWFAQTEPCLWPCMGFPNMFHGQSHNTGHLWGAEEGTEEMAAINNWSKESCLGVQLFTIRQPVISIACLDRSLGLSEEWGLQWLVAALPWPTMTETGCRDLFFLQKHSLLLSLRVFFFPLLSPPTCWGW